MLLSQVDDKLVFHPGCYIKPISFCTKTTMRKECSDFYFSLKNNKEGYYTCPHGMSVFLSSTGMIFTCLRIKPTYNKELATRITRSGEEGYNPVLTEQQIRPLIDGCLQFVATEKKNCELNQRIEDQNRTISDVTNELKNVECANEERYKKQIKELEDSAKNLIQDVGGINASVKSNSDLLIDYFNSHEYAFDCSDVEQSRILSRLESVFAGCATLAFRLKQYDYEKNPDALKKETTIQTRVHSTFWKYKFVLSNYKDHYIPINFTGESYDEITVYPLFEMIPFTLLENAAKYSYYGGDRTIPISVDFSHPNDHLLRVTIESYSPYCGKDEVNMIFNKEYRGKNAQKAADGKGLGLYYVKKLCEINGFSISAHSKDNITTIGCVPYAPFVVTVDFPLK